jgi:alpha-beta hydrolase superfamily lysophospholipase
MVCKWQPGKSSFLVGHSMGALISALFLLDYQAKLAGAILSGPSVKVPNNASPITISMEILKAMQRITAEASKITLPVLIVQGSADRLVDPDGARILYGAVSSADKTIKTYDGLYHEVFNEPEHDQVLGDVEAWLESRL